MNYFVDIICEDKRVRKSDCIGMRTAIEHIVSHTNLFSEKTTFCGLYIVINPDLSLYNNVEQITSRLYITRGQDYDSADTETLNNFKLFCIGLNAGLFKPVDKVLLILETERQKDPHVGSSSQEKNDDEQKENDEERPSYTSQKPIYSLDKVIMSNKTKSDIGRAIALITHRDKIFNDWGFTEIDPHTKTILCFYGAPGTGKTMCAHALASTLQKNILIASYASIESKWVGEGPKNLQQIFKDASEQNAILFFDEADSFLSKRVANADTGSDKHYNRMSNEMFQLLENHNGVIIFATNMVTDFDKAFKSRILAFVEFSLPDHDTRKKLIRTMIPKKVPLMREFSEEEISKLAELSEGFSGREIRKSILTALAEGAMQGTEHFSIREFEVGFNNVKEDTDAIDRCSPHTISGDIVADFLNTADVNRHILDICLFVGWQNDKPNSHQMSLLLNLANILRCDKPDFSVSYAEKNLDDAIKNVVENERMEETLRYCTELISYAECTPTHKMEIFSSLCGKLGINEPPTAYIKLINIYEEISLLKIP